MLWPLRPSDIREVATTASAEILRLEAIRWQLSTNAHFIRISSMPENALHTASAHTSGRSIRVRSNNGKLRYAIAVLERIFESEDVPPGEEGERNDLRIAPTLNGRDAFARPIRAVAAYPNPDAQSAAERTADALTELIRRYPVNAATGIAGGQRPISTSTSPQRISPSIVNA